MAAKVKLIALDNVNAVPHKVAIRSIVTALAGDSKMTEAALIAELMNKYDASRAKWIAQFGNSNGFDVWFTKQVMG